MALKPLRTWGTDKQSDASRVNHNDRVGSGNFVSDGLTEGSDPNAMGPTMRQLYTATAGSFTGEGGGFNGADMHNDHYEQPYPRRQRGAVANGVGRSSPKTGVSGKWPGSDT